MSTQLPVLYLEILSISPAGVILGCAYRSKQLPIKRHFSNQEIFSTSQGVILEEYVKSGGGRAVGPPLHGQGHLPPAPGFFFLSAAGHFLNLRASLGVSNPGLLC